MIRGLLAFTVGVVLAYLGVFGFAIAADAQQPVSPRHIGVLLAGFACGMGLIAMIAIALGLIFKSVSFLPF